MYSEFDPDLHPQTKAMESLVAEWIGKQGLRHPIVMLDMPGTALYDRAAQYRPVVDTYVAVETIQPHSSARWTTVVSPIFGRFGGMTGWVFSMRISLMPWRG